MYGKANFRNIYWADSFKSTEMFALREFETFQLNEVIYSAQWKQLVGKMRDHLPNIKVCRSLYDIPSIKGVSEMV